MIHSIGRRKVDPPRDLSSLLLECHGRIRSFVALARSVAEGTELPAEQTVGGCESVQRYFELALPLHVADEERSIQPRLSGLDQTVDSALEAMQRQHAEHEQTLRAFLAALSAVRSDPKSRAHREALGSLTRELDSAFQEHLALEESIILPAIARLLSEDVQGAIVAELRARRGG